MRMSKEEADMMGIVIDDRGRATIKKPVGNKPLAIPRTSVSANSINVASSTSRNNKGRDPQRMIYDALVLRLGEHEVILEKSNLIPDRAYRADIYLPASQVIVEMDGFQYHRSKDAFQSDRIRQNLFVAHGFPVLRYFASQVFRELDFVTNQIVSLHHKRISVAEE